jgi:hypothetical protein
LGERDTVIAGRWSARARPDLTITSLERSSVLHGSGLFSLANERVHDSCGRFDVANEIDSFTRKDHFRVEVVRFGGLSIAFRLAYEVLFEISLAPIPPPRESVS